MNLSQTYISVQPTLNANWLDRLSVFRNTFDGELFLISVKFDKFSKLEIVAISRSEIDPLKEHLLENANSRSNEPSSVSCSIRAITVDEFCEERDPRNGNVQEGLASDRFVNLVGRLGHLEGQDLSSVVNWTWKDASPHPDK